MTLNHITIDDLKIEEYIDEIKISLLGGHTYIDKDVFFNDVFEAIGEEYEINALRNDYSMLYIKSYDAIYFGAFACNAFVQNSIIDLLNDGKCKFFAVDDDDKPDIIKDFFE